MSEFIVKTVQDWHHCNEKLPEIGQTVEVLATMITRASLVGTDPQSVWAQEQEMQDAQTEVKLWREINEPAA